MEDHTSGVDRKGRERRPSPEETQPPLTAWGNVWRYLLCALISIIIFANVAQEEWAAHRYLLAAEVGCGLTAYVAVWFRRRWPVAIGILTGALGTLSGIAGGPATLAAVSVATRRRPVAIIVVCLINMAGALTYTFVAPFHTSENKLFASAITVVVNIAMMGWGMYIGSRREVFWNLRQRAERAESEQALRAQQARDKERARIAREMHDVLAHRITQVSMHAGALSFREDLSATQLREGLGTIQGHANEALHELRGVLGVLRDETGQAVDRPQPTYEEVADLVRGMRNAGLNVSLDDEVDQSSSPVPDATGRAVFRIVQEGLTNAGKHARGAAVTLRIWGNPDAGVSVEIRNPQGFSSTATPGAGLGLIGLAERAEQRGGILSSRTESGTFILSGWLPWGA